MNTIYLIGLGPGDPQSLTLRSLFLLRRIKHVYVRTEKHPGLKILKKYHIKYKTLDQYYENSESFEETYGKIARFIINSARIHKKVVYAVPGSPLFAEKTVQLIRKKSAKAEVRCVIIPSVSFFDAVAAEVNLPQQDEMVILDAMRPEFLLDYPDRHVLIMQVYDKQVASRTKLTLNELYPDCHPVTAIRGAGLSSGKKVVSLKLSEMDRLPFIDHLTTFYLPPLFQHGTARLVRIMRQLRSKEGCPWDQEQDHNSLKPYLLEEAYEVLHAIDSGNNDNLCEELGDLLLQIVFHCQIAVENNGFSYYDVVNGISKKLIRRHPHVFSSPVQKTAAEVNSTWQKIKRSEKGNKQDTIFTLENYLPSLLRAQKLQRQASSVGFDWPDSKGAWDKLEEELKELKDVYNKQDKVRIEEELGDLLFSVVNVARFLHVDAEQALARSTVKFFRRLCFVEKMAQNEGGGIADYPLSKLDKWWDEAKIREKD